MTKTTPARSRLLELVSSGSTARNPGAEIAGQGGLADTRFAAEQRDLARRHRSGQSYP
jgi:hypothetical protein